MLAVRNGDVSALGILFERFHVALFDFLTRVTGDRTAAEDMVQDVFVRILKYRSTYRGEGSFETWVFRIARNARADSFRTRTVAEPLDGDGEALESWRSVPDEMARGQTLTLGHATWLTFLTPSTRAWPGSPGSATEESPKTWAQLPLSKLPLAHASVAKRVEQRQQLVEHRILPGMRRRCARQRFELRVRHVDARAAPLPHQADRQTMGTRHMLQSSNDGRDAWRRRFSIYCPAHWIC